MADSHSSGLAALRQPEYTGENRCWPCTTVNTLIAVVLSVVVAGVASTAAATGTAAGLGFVVFLLSLAAIWLRGYLVPGTPELTKRYMPDWLLAWFGKEPEHPLPKAGDVRDVEPETFLSEAGAIEPCEDIDDLCLNAAFAERWDEILADTPEEVDPEEVRTVFGLDGDGEYEVMEYGQGVVLQRGAQRVGEWPSQTALRVDVAGARVIAETATESWAELDPVARGAVLNGLRIFLEECPGGGPVEMKEETVESCCNSYEVVALICADSGDRVLEQRVS
ncbi:hypothetical protein [Haloarchaeobius sp. TZWSO28]|uniref:hypothetical protein n=1 Tax=unclassified Haloarchaeobius TaxID=2614452 RepID=UPI003EBD2F9B